MISGRHACGDWNPLNVRHRTRTSVLRSCHMSLQIVDVGRLGLRHLVQIAVVIQPVRNGSHVPS